MRTHPETAFAVQGAIQHQRLRRLAVADNADDVVEVALVVAIAADGNASASLEECTFLAIPACLCKRPQFVMHKS